MKKIILTIGIIITQILIVSANNENIITNEKEISEQKANEIIDNSIGNTKYSYDYINNFINENDLGEIIMNEYSITDGGYIAASKKDFYSDQIGNIINGSEYSSSSYNMNNFYYNHSKYYIIKNDEIIETFDYRNIANNLGNLSIYVEHNLFPYDYLSKGTPNWHHEEPSVSMSPNGKYYGYSYIKSDTYCVNINGKDECHYDNDYTPVGHYFFPRNIYINNNGDYAYSKITWYMMDGLVPFYNEFFINGKNTKEDLDDKLISFYSSTSHKDNPLLVSDLIISENGERYMALVGSYDKGYYVIVDGEIVSNEMFSSTQFEFIFSPDSKDYYYKGFEKETNEELFYKNGEKIDHIIVSDDINNDLSINYFYYGYDSKDNFIVVNNKGKKYRGNYEGALYIGKENNLYNFISIKGNKYYLFSIKDEEGEISNQEKIKIDDKTTNKDIEDKNNYKLNNKESETINLIGNLINKRSDKDKYVSLLDSAKNKYSEGERNYEIITKILEIIK